MKKIISPAQDPETGEWRYKGKWWASYPNEEVEKDENALDEYWDRELDRRRDEE